MRWYGISVLFWLCKAEVRDGYISAAPRHTMTPGFAGKGQGRLSAF